MNKKEALTQATAELLWERGYVGTSPSMILRRSNAGQGSMYHHFSGKAELAAAAMAHLADELRSSIEVALKDAESAIERAGAYLDLERDPLMGCRLGRLAQDPDVVSDEQLRAPASEFFVWLEERLSEVLAEGVRSGELRADTDVRTVASMAIAAVQGGYVLSRARQDPEVFRRAVTGVKQTLDGLRSREDGGAAAAAVE